MSGRLYSPSQRRVSRTRLCHTILRCSFLLALFIGASSGLTDSAAAQPDSTRRAILRAKGLPPDHTPRGAVWRALAAPGWGQLYNRQYYKMPFVYAGLAGFAAAIVYSNDRYLLYRRAALFRGTDDYPQYEDEYQQVVSQIGGDVDASVLRRQRDKFRRYRDLSVVGVGLYYALSVLDAYVSAQLLTFDVGEDLSIRVHPAERGVTTRIQWRF